MRASQVFVVINVYIYYYIHTVHYICVIVNFLLLVRQSVTYLLLGPDTLKDPYADEYQWKCERYCCYKRERTKRDDNASSSAI